jgi:hypothetical protein
MSVMAKSKKKFKVDPVADPEEDLSGSKDCAELG